MAATFEVDGDNVTITFTFSPTLESGQNILDLASKAMFNGSEEEWQALTNQEKLDIVDRLVRRTVIATAARKRMEQATPMLDASVPLDL